MKSDSIIKLTPKTATRFLLALVTLAFTFNVNATWTNHSPTGPDFNSFAVAPSNTATIYASSATSGSDGIWRSTNSGGNWDRLDAGYAYVAVAVKPTDELTVIGYAASGPGGAGIRYSLDGGMNWQDATGEGTYDSRVFDYSVSDPSIVFAGGQTTVNGELIKSTDSGITWTSVPVDGDNTPAVTSIAVDPSDENIIYAGVKPASGNDGVYKSTDAGATWVWKPNFPFTTARGLAVAPLSPHIVYGGSSGSGEVQRSTDGGNTWQSVNLPLAPDFFSVFAVAVSPTNSSIVYAGGNGGATKVVASTDCGATWSAVDSTNLIVGPGKLFYDTSASLVYAGDLNNVLFSKAALTVATGSCPAISSAGGTSAGGGSGGGVGYLFIGLMLLTGLFRLIRRKNNNAFKPEFTRFGG